MVNTLTSIDLNLYLFDRLHNSEYPMETQQTPDRQGIVVSASVNRKVKTLTIKPKIMKRGRASYIEFSLESEDQDIAEFLGREVKSDHIFCKGGLLYSQQREDDLPRLKRILKRDYLEFRVELDDKGKPIGGGLLVARIGCKVLDDKVNNETLRKAVWDYMLKPVLLSLYHRQKPAPSPQ